MKMGVSVLVEVFIAVVSFLFLTMGVSLTIETLEEVRRFRRRRSMRDEYGHEEREGEDE